MNPHHKKAKYHPSRNQTTLETVVDYIFALPSLNHVVIEFRAGRKSPQGFTSFMTPDDFESIHRFIKKVAKKSPPYSDYIYERGKYLHSRLTANAAGMVTSGVYKEKLATFDMETNHSHDIRIDVMRESPIVPIPVCPEEGYVYERKKVKYTIETKDWLLDLFEVTTYHYPSSPSSSPSSSPPPEDDVVKSFELEAQVKISSIRNVPDKKACVDLLENVFVEVHNLLARLQATGAQVFPDLKLEKITRPEHYQYLKSQFLQVVPNINNHHRFPGSLPSALERSKIKLLQKGDYWVSEKSDGLRYLLFIVDQGSYLVDRRMDFYQIHKFPLLIELFGASGVTLLDGEMVRNLRTGKLMYLIFDILALNGQTNIGMYNLSERLGIVGKKVVSVFRDSVHERGGKDYYLKLQFTITGKIFRPKALIKELASMIKHNEKGERLFVDDKRCHRNDGLIFTPSGPYLPYASSHLIKWKYGDRLTIDFLFKFTSEGHVALVGEGGEVKSDWKGFDLLPDDWNKLTTALATTKHPDQAVIECAYDYKSDKWRFLTLRPDKDRPNHRTTVQHTLFIVKENITIEELVNRVPILNMEDDHWEEDHTEIEDSQEEPILTDALSNAPDSSPTVDLPSTPLPSPIVCKTTPPLDEAVYSP
jgi:mRNA guanylyltransferase